MFLFSLLVTIALLLEIRVLADGRDPVVLAVDYMGQLRAES